ncbi:ribokinase [Flexivirga caeni]|uniref:ribokinase n=1 Tax=Flexivirga caeni TaxID=2294115 RepID=UPI001315285C|nr:ribokinase [Flexivirga caeni]
MSDRVVVIGSVNIDHTVEVARFPHPGETLLASSLTSSVGGKGANQAAAAARSGASVLMVAAVGNDAEGAQALATLASAGVDTSGVHRVADARTGSAWITVAASDNTILVAPGANYQWSQGLPSLRQSDVVLCQLEIPVPLVESAAVAARGRFVLNAAPSVRLDDDLLRRCGVLIVNEHELAESAGLPDVDAADTQRVIAASRSLIARGTSAVVTTLGGRGAILCTTTTTLMAATPPTPEVVDSTGAGDAFCGVFAARLAAGDSLGTALRYAVTAGSLAVRHPTAQGGYESFARLPDLVDQTPSIIEEPRP